MDKEQQIEEMTSKMQRCYEKNVLLNFKWFAEALYAAGYRKVIYGRDSLSDLLNEEIKELSLIEKTHKETAKNIADWINHYAKNGGFGDVLADVLEELATTIKKNYWVQ